MSLYVTYCGFTVNGHLSGSISSRDI